MLQNRLYDLYDGATHTTGADIVAPAGTFDNSSTGVNQNNNYSYDELGNLIADKREEIGNIQWTVAGKVKRIARTPGSTKPSLVFAYGADGQRISKQVGEPANGGYKEYYIRDASGNIMATYRYLLNPVPNTNPPEYESSLKLTERPIYGSSRLGSHTRQMEMVGSTPPQYYPYIQPMHAPLKRYELTDHLGNVATVVTGKLLPGNGAGSAYQADVVSAQGYEAFGSLLPGRNYSSSNYRFGFNGQEKDDEVYGAEGTSYTAEFWQYDPRTGRRWNTDPVVKPWESVYATFAGNPVMMVDPNGANASSDVTKNKDGSYTVVDAKNDGDNNIYVRGEDGKRTGEIIGQTLTPFDFMATNDQTGEFRTFDQKRDGVTFRLDNLKVTGTVFDNVGESTERSVGKVYGADGNALIRYATGNFADERARRTAGNAYSDLSLLRDMSGNKQEMDFKSSLKLHPNTAIGLTTESGTYITTLRAIGNIAFGMNMEQCRPPAWSKGLFYSTVMPKVGEYNQAKNTGVGYNEGHPFYGEHQYSGTFIHLGFFGRMP